MTRVQQWCSAILALGMATGWTPVAAADLPPDALAKVGDQVITMSEIDTTINSSGVIGMPIPTPGTPERNNARLTLLDRLISANLLYLDAQAKHVGDNPVFRHEVEGFTDATLAMLYKQRYLVGDLPVTQEEVEEYYRRNVSTEITGLTGDQRLAIEAKIRKEKLTEQVAGVRGRLRDGVKVEVKRAALDPAGDAQRAATAVVGRIAGTQITWGEVSAELAIAPTLDQRVEMLEDHIDRRLMVKKARAAGLEDDPAYRHRIAESTKARLINLHRAQLVEGFAPSDEEIRAFYEANRQRITIPEARKIQMVVVKDKQAAQALKEKIAAGKMTLYEAARDHSIDPNAKRTLGEMGWVEQGTGFPALDRLTFSLDLDTLGGPVESPAGWHLIQVLEIRPAADQDLNDPKTRKKTRRMLIHVKVDDYTTKLRAESFPVEVYQETLNRIMQSEVGQPQGASGDDAGKEE